MRFAMDLAAEAELGIVIGLDDSRPCFPQRGDDFLGVVADARHNTHAGHDNAFHLTTNLSEFQAALRPRVWREQADTQIARRNRSLAVRLDEAIPDAEVELS